MLKPEGCLGCPLEPKSNGFSRYEGTGANGVLIMGEALGQKEYEDSLPFRPWGSAGSLLASAMRIVRTPRSAFLIDNVIKCQPPHDSLVDEPYEHGAIAHCMEHYGARTLADPRVKCILALGATAFRTLTGLEGKRLSISDTRGYVLPNVRGYPAPVIGGYHPAFIRRGKLAYTDYLVHDLRKAIAVGTGRYNSFGEAAQAKLKYQTHPSIDEARAFYYRVKDNPGLMLSVDIETDMTADIEEEEYDEISGSSPIIQCQFSLGKNEGIAFPWEGAYIKVALAILALSNVKLGHNFWIFDGPKLRNAGARINGVVHDSMWIFHHFKPDLEMGLQKVASMCDFPFIWKHLSGDPKQLAWYGIADVDAPHWIFSKLEKVMRAQGIWDGYEQYVLGLHPILVSCQDRGLGIDLEERGRLETFVEEKRDETYQGIQAKIPDEMRKRNPPMGYVRQPEAVNDLLVEFESLAPRLAALQRQGKSVVDAEDYVTRRSYKPMMKEGEEHHLWSKFRIGRFQLPGEADEEDDRLIDRWVQVIDFNPVSSPQIIAYCKAHGHKVPITLNDGKETTAKKELERLAISTKDVMYDEIIRYREYNKVLTTDLPQWRHKQDGGVHTTFTYAPANAQLSSRNPNVQNASKHSPLGVRFRRTIRARTVGGRRRRLVEFDYSAFHAVMLGREARCKMYMDLAARDVHSWFGSYIIGQPIPYDLLLTNEAEFMERLKAFKRDHKAIRDKQAKPTILGVGFGLQKRKLYWMNREFIKGESEAGKLLDMIKSLLPPLFRYQDQQVELASQQTYLKNDYGFIRWFYDARGEDAEKIKAYRTASNAHCMMREKILTLEAMGVLERFQFCNTIHDSLLFEPWEDELNECVSIVQPVMEAPCMRLADPVVCPDGLIIKVEAMHGYNWGPYDSKNPDDNPGGMRAYVN